MTATNTTTTTIQAAAAAAERTGAIDPVALDVSGPLPFVDAFLILTGRSERNVSAIAREVEDELTAAGVKTIRREGRDAGRWALIDTGDVVVHVFHEEERDFYALERLWGDCPVIAVEPAPVDSP